MLVSVFGVGKNGLRGGRENREIADSMKKKHIQLNPAIAYFKGLVRIMLYIEVLFIANI